MERAGTVEYMLEEVPLKAGTRVMSERLDIFPHPFDVFRLLKDEPYCFFLDSGMDPEKLGRYSFVGSFPFLVFRSRGPHIEIAYKGRTQRVVGDPFQMLSILLKKFHITPSPEVHLPFTGGAVGYFGYDLCHFIEELPSTTVDDISAPDCYFAFYDTVVAFDNLLRQAYICSCDNGEVGAEMKIERLRAKLSRLSDSADPPPKVEQLIQREVPLYPFRSNFTREGYLAAIRRAKEYIAAGDIYQVNLSQRFIGRISVSPFELYAQLRRRNPAPFAAYLDFGEVKVLSSSPERFLRFSGETRVVYTRPIKGTRPRGSTPVEDEALARELLSSEKDRAELVMIVDLERNDLGRVCEIGSVHVPELVVLEKYATVYHLVSTVAGRLPPDRDRLDLLRATFPGGSITGAPKIRAMEIIDELEPTKRGIYTGSIGYLSFTGDMDLNIVIRTFVVKGSKVSFQVGGGIVADSDPEAEYQETLDKARALMETLAYAGLDGSPPPPGEMRSHPRGSIG